jgi:nicotinate-nucleotide adenylyltransferase
MNLALFGGTFDPPHLGHLAVARAAAKRFDLKQVLFVPADVPPHKQKQPLTPYPHRYAMTALACAAEKFFVPSTLEAASAGKPSYTLETVRKVKAGLRAKDRLFVIVGADMWATIGTWWHAEELLQEAEFIIANRPGYSLAEIAAALPASLRPKQDVISAFMRGKGKPMGDFLILGDLMLHLLADVHVDVSSTQVRLAARASRPLGKLVPAPVADYIKKTRLYS